VSRLISGLCFLRRVIGIIRRVSKPDFSFAYSVVFNNLIPSIGLAIIYASVPFDMGICYDPFVQSFDIPSAVDFLLVFHSLSPFISLAI
jgi:hypothetical protein